MDFLPVHYTVFVYCVLVRIPVALRYFNYLLWCLSGERRLSELFCVLYCVLKLCTVISTLRWAVLTVLWIGFCHTGPIYCA